MLDARKCVHTPGDQPESLAPGWVVRDPFPYSYKTREEEEEEEQERVSLSLSLSLLSKSWTRLTRIVSRNFLEPEEPDARPLARDVPR